ncbi:MAG: PD-(D/E)XK nuclease family protein [Thermodesulfobacteriota bacterium]|nr:PD-(D/E)XK nuclease family protein [Thermodesulfobacteriota bacterium]
MDYREKVISAAAQGALVLTANKRLSRYLHSRFDQQMQVEGESVWSTPQIFSYEGWLTRCLEGLGAGWRLLNQHQQQYLWEEQIENSSRGTTLELLQLSKTAEKAIQAHRLLNEYNLSLDGQYLTEDQLVFSRWQRRYKDHCQQHDWLDQSDLPGLICSALKGGKLNLPQQVLLIGFDQLAPGLLLLMKTVNDAGGCCEEVSLQGEQNGKIVCYAARDRHDEIESAARWARSLLDRGEGSIGVVVPDLQQHRRQIERIFREQIDPAATVALNDDEAVFSLSLGGSLADQGVVHAALECLGAGHQLSLDQTSFLLRTPYLDGALREADSRAFFDQKLRSFRQQHFKLSRLKTLLEEKTNLAIFSQVLKTIQSAQQLNDKVLPGVWAARFADQLFLLGWPGERSIASSEFQASKMWQEKALTALVALDPLLPPISRQRAFNLLRRISQEIEFQLEGSVGPLQVVGLLESSGLMFQHLWVMGLGEAVLPARPQPNPFIPLKLQRDYDMPHASAARELFFAEQVVARLQSASDDIVFSYPRLDGDCALRPSPLIPPHNPEILPPLADLLDLSSLLKSNLPGMDTLSDHHGPRMDQALVEGGTSLLKDQAHCPFRAFFHHRLHAQQFAEATPGIAPMARGDLLHLVLELIWKGLQNQTSLLSLAEQERIELIKTQVAAAFTAYFEHKSAPAEQLLQLEAERVVTLVQEWLVKIEMERDPFHVLETEQQHIEKIGPLQIRLKVDRIDQLEGGERIVIDYKTGVDLHAEDFLSQPLIEPQLPIYAVADPAFKADGIVFAKLRRGECRFVGVVREKGLLGKVRELTAYPQSLELGLSDWDELLIFWRQQIDQLAENFVAGEAVVQPYDLIKSCQYCDLSGICRIQEATMTPGVTS